ncbi:MAG: hypothetical protein HZB29_13450 [Nitrospinae bacterium]|nr:hypothetical protein [Nitrospinota bacterium]
MKQSHKKPQVQAAFSGRAGESSFRFPDIEKKVDVARKKVDEILSSIDDIPPTSPVAIIGMELLGRMVGDRKKSNVANRLIFISRIIDDLRGAYTNTGIVQWFNRKRTQLDGKAPVDILKGDWSPDDKGPLKVMELAHSLASSNAT